MYPGAWLTVNLRVRRCPEQAIEQLTDLELSDL
jgi:hypothetical protein